ncbi:hypothetical protein LHP98_13555 [Rhodobacter sp. Har01]|uniref:hypothetical protein n=1 Tax=Rhodobacter sp. Har01 TaxID=2883999 RepID=UPI001D05D90D|nr:hypothetical protein [Rhodobacter sp. Har01]MCB6179146.1 hypothetical protein [Rhodobacter sp. Har01]
MRRVAVLAAAFAVAFASPPARADAVSDALDAATAAYANGKLTETARRIAEANSALSALQSAALLALLPPAPDGWTRSENTDMTATMVVIGGGSGIEATYSGPDEQYFTITIFADNPMFLSMQEMYNNEMLVTMMGGKKTIGGAEYLTQAEDSLFTIVGERLMVQATGAPVAVMEPVLAQIDHAALAAYGQ